MKCTFFSCLFCAKLMFLNCLFCTFRAEVLVVHLKGFVSLSPSLFLFACGEGISACRITGGPMQSSACSWFTSCGVEAPLRVLYLSSSHPISHLSSIVQFFSACVFISMCVSCVVILLRPAVVYG